MRVIIQETGEEKILSFVHPRTGIDCAVDFIGGEGALSDGQFRLLEEAGAYSCNFNTYTWWQKICSQEKELEERIIDFVELYGEEDVFRIVDGYGGIDLEDHARIVIAALEKGFMSK